MSLHCGGSTAQGRWGAAILGPCEQLLCVQVGDAPAYTWKDDREGKGDAEDES